MSSVSLALATAAMVDSMGTCLLAMECVCGVTWVSPWDKDKAYSCKCKAVCSLWYILT